MTDFTNSAAELAQLYNELSGKNVKPSSYSKAKFLELIESLTPVEPKVEAGRTPGATQSLVAEEAEARGVNPKVLRQALRRAGFHAPYTLTQVRQVKLRQ